MATLVQQEQHQDRLKALEQGRLARIAGLSLLGETPPFDFARLIR